jgi:hypothetical protein
MDSLGQQWGVGVDGDVCSGGNIFRSPNYSKGGDIESFDGFRLAFCLLLFPFSGGEDGMSPRSPSLCLNDQCDSRLDSPGLAATPERLQNDSRL